MTSFSEPVAVTGASGYIASHVVRELLARGATVHAVARDPGKLGHLEALARELPGTLRTFRADLLDRAALAAAFAGCGTVIHTASPFLLTVRDVQRDLVAPALDGTRNVLSSLPETVRRVVLTSSVVAIYGDACECTERGGTFDETQWNTSSTPTHEPYAYSKTVAERLAWEMAGQQDRWRLVVINPSFVMGPSLSARVDGTSVDTLLRLVDGRLRTGIWQEVFGWVDVREVATAHVEAAIRPDAEGRHILCAEALGFWDVIPWLKADVPGAKVPLVRVPRWLGMVIGPLNGFSVAHVRRSVEWPVQFDNQRSRERLGIVYRPVRETLRDMVAQLRG